MASRRQGNHWCRSAAADGVLRRQQPCVVFCPQVSETGSEGRAGRLRKLIAQDSVAAGDTLKVNGLFCADAVFSPDTFGRNRSWGCEKICMQCNSGPGSVTAKTNANRASIETTDALRPAMNGGSFKTEGNSNRSATIDRSSNQRPAR